MPKLLPLALLIALALTGCAGGSADGSPDAAAASDGHGEAAPAEDGHGEAAADGGHGEKAEPPKIPEDFPTDYVPLLEADLLHGGSSGGVWSVVLASHDLEADLAHAVELLLGAGFTQTVAEAAYGDFTGPDYLVRVFVLDDPTYGESVTYQVTTIGGETPPVEEPAKTEDSSGH